MSAKADIQGGALGLKGDYAPKIGELIGDLPGELAKLATGYRGCGNALNTFAGALEQAQTKARRARADLDVAARSRRAAEYDLDQLAPGWDVHRASPPDLEAFVADKPQSAALAVTRRAGAVRDEGLAESLGRQAAALRGDAERDCE